VRESLTTFDQRSCSDQLDALGLVVIVIVLCNTIYMDAALDQLRAGRFNVRDGDVARLSPLDFDHINNLGRDAFTLPEKVARGELRPLRHPGTASDAAQRMVGMTPGLRTGLAHGNSVFYEGLRFVCNS
jgi:hypothetical protein